MIRNSIIKLVSISLIIGLNWFGISTIIETSAYLNDMEVSQDNVYSATTLGFSLNSPGDFSPNVTPTATSSRNINLTDDGLLGFNYSVSSTSTSGVLCDYLTLTAKLKGSDVYTGTISGFNYNAGEFSTTTDEWQFTANLTSNDPALQNQTCNFGFIFDGVQAEGPGFSDQEIISNTITAGIWQKVVINKVYYDVDSKHGAEGDNEWIEIYNPLDTPIDISGWLIVDNHATDTIPVFNPIPAHGFAVITGNASTWGYWDIPADVVKIVLNSDIGNGLANGGDRVILKMSNNVEIDAMSYGDDNYAFDPPCPDVAEGHILGRVPTGIDTDTANDWKDLGLPSVTVVWPNGGEVLWVGRTYDLKWTATNPNGDNSALIIDIWYSSDSGATWAKIATSTENDGIFNWRVPLTINGYYVPSSHARIKVAAWGPENFMIQNWDMSDEDFCPPIDYSLLTPEELEYLKGMGMIETNSQVIKETSTTTPEIIEIATTTPETISEEVPVEPTEEIILEIVPEVVPEEPAIEEPPVVIEEIPPAIEENLPVIEQTPSQEEPEPEPEPNI